MLVLLAPQKWPFWTFWGGCMGLHNLKWLQLGKFQLRHNPRKLFYYCCCCCCCFFFFLLFCSCSCYCCYCWYCCFYCCFCYFCWSQPNNKVKIYHLLCGVCTSILKIRCIEAEIWLKQKFKRKVFYQHPLAEICLFLFLFIVFVVLDDDNDDVFVVFLSQKPSFIVWSKSVQ